MCSPHHTLPGYKPQRVWSFGGGVLVHEDPAAHTIGSPPADREEENKHCVQCASKIKHSIQVYYLVSNVDSIRSFTSTCVKESSHMNCTVARPSPSSYTPWVSHPSSRCCSITGAGTTWLLLEEGHCGSHSWYLAVHHDRCWQWGHTPCEGERPALPGRWRETLPYQCPCEWVRVCVCVWVVRMWGVACYALTVKQALFRPH